MTKKEVAKKAAKKVVARKRKAPAKRKAPLVCNIESPVVLVHPGDKDSPKIQGQDLGSNKGAILLYDGQPVYVPELTVRQPSDGLATIQ